MSYYNTTGLKGQQLSLATQKAISQEERIYNALLFRPRIAYTPFQISEMMGDAFPITSIRRAITNLTKQGKLEQTNIYMVGDYGRLNKSWRVKE